MRPCKVTVFDFSMIMERTEKRVERDLLGAGPKSVEELRAIRVRLKQRYDAQLERTKQRVDQQLQQEQKQQEDKAVEDSTGDVTDRKDVETTPGGISGISVEDARKVGEVVSRANNVACGATTMAVEMLAKIKKPEFKHLRKAEYSSTNEVSQQDLGSPHVEPDLMAFSASDEDGDWVQSPMQAPTEAIEHFSIDEDDML